jgi:hypothetical protein
MRLSITFIVAAAVGGGVAFYLGINGGSQAAQNQAVAAEAKSYVRNLRLSAVELKATDSYMGGTIVEIVGKIQNAGDRPLNQVDVNCIFYDPYGLVVLREKVSIVKSKTGGLKPGETKTFRLPFDSLPQSWNQTLPQVVIANIRFG